MHAAFLHHHPKMEAQLGVPDGHVIVDRKDWIKALDAVQDESRVPQPPSGPKERLITESFLTL